MTTEPHEVIRSFNNKIRICETSHKHLLKGAIPCQPVCNKMALDKITIIHRKGEFSKSTWSAILQSAKICNVLQRPADSSELIVVKLEEDIKYWGHVYFEPVHPHTIYQALSYLKAHNKF